jgi:putative inorganic carbon (hco3(-)) transporter
LNKKNQNSTLAIIQRVAGQLVQYEIWPVSLMIAASFVWPSLLPAAVVTAAVFWFLRWISTGRLSKRTPADAGVILLLVMVLVTLWATALPAKTIPQIYRLLTGVALFYAIVNWCNTPKRLHLLLLGTTLVELLLAIFAVVSVQWPVGKLAFFSGQLYQMFSLLVSDAVHPNVLAGSLIILLPIPLAELVFAWGKMDTAAKIIYIEAVLLGLGMLALTQSRGAWIALGAVVLTFILLGWRRGWVVCLGSFILALLAINQLGIPWILETAFSSGTINGWDGRREIWSRAIYMIQDFPFTGIGMGSFGDVADALYPFFSISRGAILHAHNLFLQIAVDLGIPGLIAWLAILLPVIVLSWKLLQWGRTHQTAECRALGIGLLGSQVALLVHGMTDAVTWGMVRPAPLVWAIWGLAIAGWYVYIQTESKVPIQQELAEQVN